MNTDNVEDIYELSPLQQVMLFQTLYAPESGVYVEQLSFTVRGHFNLPAFAEAWQQVIDRHTSLRTSFYWDDLDKPLQVVNRKVKLPLVEYDWRALTPAEQQQQLAESFIADRRIGFQLDQAPLMRLTSFQLEPACYQLLWSFHHLLVDGWSVQLIFKDVNAVYEANCRARSLSLERSRPYGDYIEWLQKQNVAEAEAFWKARLKGFRAPTRIALQKNQSMLAVDFGEDDAEREVHLSGSLSADVQSFCRKHGLTLNTLIQGAWALLLSRYSGDDDVVFGSIVSGRPATLENVETMVGLFINTLPVRVRVSGGDSLLPWLQELQQQELEARKYEWSHLVQVQGWSDVPRGTQMFDTVLVFENYPMADSLRTDGSDNTRLLERTNLPLTLFVVPGANILIKIQYKQRDFDTAVVDDLLRHFSTVLAQVVERPDRLLSSISILTETEQQEVLKGSSTIRKNFHLDHSLVELFASQAESRPDATAFICGNEQLTYRELDERSNRLANHLQSLGVGPEVVIGVCLERSLELPVALLAIFKTGGVYLPLDPAYPPRRLAFMLEDARASVMITRSQFARHFSNEFARTILWDDRDQFASYSSAPVASNIQATDQAYIVYTSGSTGKPKGVAVEHCQILNRLAWMWDEYPFAPGEVSAQKTAISFVDSIWELLGPLLQAVPTVIVPDESVKDTQELVRILAEHGVTRLWFVPSMLRVMLDQNPDLQHRLPLLRFWVSSGEPLTPALVQRFQKMMPGSVLYNLYGTSEVWDVSWYDPQRSDSSADKAPIGTPIPNVAVYILDESLQLLPRGVPGELYVGGVALARGYLNRPELTAEKFIPHPFSAEPGARLYKSGDLARYLPDGNIEFLGRCDQQVKIRGYRIELEEIESLLNLHQEIKQAVVTASADATGDYRLVGYVVCNNGNSSSLIGNLREYLELHLPDHMVPSAFLLMDDLPLTPSGKIDRRALPEPVQNLSESKDNYVAPRSEVEEALAAMYAEVLGLERVGIHDHFFRDLGGHSMVATQMISRLRERLEIELPLRVFFEAPTVARLAQEIDKRKRDQKPRVPTIKPIARENYRVDLSAQAGTHGD